MLVGAGHAHLEVLRQQILDPLPAELELISAGSHHHYSGMVPGYLYGAYGEKAIAFDLAAIARRAGIPFTQQRAEALDPARRMLRLADGSEHRYDLISFNVGSRAAGTEIGSVTRNATLVKPMSEAVQLRERLVALAASTEPGLRSVAVVGGGAAGVEVACSAQRLLADSGQDSEVALIEAGDTILAGYSDRFRQRATGILRRKSIRLVTGRRVVDVESTSVSLDDGERLPADLTVWLTGAVAWPLFASSPLECDHRGFLLTDDNLRSLSDPRIFAVGDCGTMKNHPDTPKAGVYAVRQGPVLAAGLRAALAAEPLPTYHPQGDFLSLLNTADGRALLRYRGHVSWSRWAWRLKDWIDRRFMDKYQDLAT